jgi:hypothetical protein
VPAHDELDAEKLQTLSHWAAGLRTDPRGEVAAAGRAIELLIDEIERLHVLLWGRQLYPEQPAATLEDVWNAAPITPEDGEIEATLRGRLRRWRIHSPRPSDS